MKRLLALVLAIQVLTLSLPHPIKAAVTCTIALSNSTTSPNGNLCISEIQTIDSLGNEDADFVIITNPTDKPVSLSSVQLQYFNSAGTLDDPSVIKLSGNLVAGASKAFVSDDLKAINQTASKLGTSTMPMRLASGGGTIQIVKGTTIYDRLSWGQSTTSEGNPATAPTQGNTLIRKKIAGIIQDSDNNFNDFEVLPTACNGANINEIQPFVTDPDGFSINAWVEFMGTSDNPGNCSLLTSTGDQYDISATDMPHLGQLSVIDSAQDILNNIIPLHIGGISGQIWLASTSGSGEESKVYLPKQTVNYTNLLKNQTWSLVDNIWQPTYAPTFGLPNIYLTSLPIVDDDPNACSTIRITELLPNPTGDDTDNEWLEIYNESENSAPLTHCQINIAGSNYVFLTNDGLGPKEQRIIHSLYDTDGNEKTLSLRNTGDTIVALQKTTPTETTTIQSFLYSDAPEGQSWARFGESWQWTYKLTPNLENIALSTPPVPEITEHASSNNNISPNNLPESDTSSSQLSITELLPNPKSPATDENDEYVEIYNPTDEPIILDGYKVQTGDNYSYSFTIDKQTILAKSFLILTSGNTGLVLSNNSGRARLLDPAGIILSETDPYKDAPDGVVWAYIDNKWQWSGTATPAKSNSLSAVLVATTSKVTKVANSTTKAKTVSTPKPAKKTAVKAVKTTKPKSTKTTKPSTSPNLAISSDNKPTNIHNGVIVGIGSLALLYGIYEYRNDISNSIYKFRQNRATRRANRSKP